VNNVSCCMPCCQLRMLSKVVSHHSLNSALKYTGSTQVKNYCKDILLDDRFVLQCLTP